MTAKPYLTQSETAHLLQLSERTLERMRVEGRGPPYSKFGSLVRYPRTDLELWVKVNTFQSTTEASHAMA